MMADYFTFTYDIYGSRNYELFSMVIIRKLILVRKFHLYWWESEERKKVQCIEKGRHDDNFIYSINKYFWTRKHGWSLVPVIVLIRQISTCRKEKQLTNMSFCWRNVESPFVCSSLPLVSLFLVLLLCSFVWPASPPPPVPYSISPSWHQSHY